MKIIKFILSFCLLFLSIISHAQDDELLNKVIRFDKEKWTIQNLLQELTMEHKIVFSFEPPEIPLQKEVKFSKKELLLKEILEEAFKSTGITYVVRSKVIILKKTSTGPATEKKNKWTLSGIVKDANSAENLVGATVYVQELNTGEVANEYGFYSVTIPEGNYTIQVSCIGYETVLKDTILKENIRMNVELKPLVYTLNEIIVNGKQSRLADFQQGLSRVEMKSVKELPSLFGEADLLRNIQLLPGVTSMAEAGGDFQVRGGSWDQNLMLLDEAVVYNSNHLYGIYSTFNPDIIKDIKFYKGGIPATYGGRVSSVMDITQKEGNMKAYHMDGGLGFIVSKLSVEGPIVKDKSSFIVAARRSVFDPFLKYIKNENTKNIKPYFYDINSKVNFIINENNRIYLSSYLGNDQMQNQSSSTDYKNEVTYGNITGTLRFNHIFNNKLFSNTSMIYSRYNMLLYNSFDSLLWKNQLGLEHFEFKNEFVCFLPMHKLEFGFRSIYYNFHPGDQKPISNTDQITKINLPEQHSLESALYISDNYKIFPNTEIQIGLRFSNFNFIGPTDVLVYPENEPRSSENVIDTVHYSRNKVIKTYNYVEPRISVKYNINNNQTVSLSYNKIVQYVQLVSRTFNPLPVDMWYSSSGYIKPLMGNQVSAGWFLQTLDNSLCFSVESYYKMLLNVLEVKPGADIYLNRTLDADLLQGVGRAYGVELGINKTVGKLSGIISYTLSKSERKVDGKFIEEKINFGKYYPTDYDIPNKLTVAGEYKISNRFSLTGNFIYQTGRPISYPTGQFYYYNLLMQYYSGKNQQRYSDYHRLDLGAVLHNKTRESRRWSSYWIFSIYNVYGRENDYFIEIRQKNNSRDSEAKKTWFFSVVPSVTYNFKF